MVFVFDGGVGDDRTVDDAEEAAPAGATRAPSGSWDATIDSVHMDTPQPEYERIPSETIDVVALMEDLRRRVAAKKAAGLYTVDAMAVDRMSSEEPIAPEEIERLGVLAILHPDLTVSPSNKPGLGKLVTKIKQTLVRGTSDPLIRVATQSNEFNVTLLRYVALLSREVRVLQTNIEALEQRISPSTAESRLDAVEKELATNASLLETLRRAALPDRLGRLEHLLAQNQGTTGGAATSAAEAAMSIMADANLHVGDDAEARWSSYAASFGTGSILHLGAGSGRALERLGPDAHGIESDPDLVAVARNADRAVERGDPIDYLKNLPAATLERVLVTDLVDRLAAGELSQLAHELSRCVAPGGRVIVEGANPTTLSPAADWSATANGRARHPDVVQILLEGAGFASTHVTYPAAAATHAVVPSSSDPTLQAISQAVQELSANVYGPSHYAVHAVR
jgi:hypothetical protein